MSSGVKTAEQRFREAFERLKKGEPTALPHGTLVSQNNVAKEAGLTQGALRKSRFPSLIDEIQRYVDTHEQKPASTRQEILAQRSKNRIAKEVISDLRVQHNMAVGLLTDANARIIELTRILADRDAQIDDLNINSKVTNLPGRVAKNLVKRADKITGMSTDGTKESDH